MGDSGGTYTRSDGTRTGTTVFQQQESAGLNIESAQLDAEANDMATALNNRLFKDGTNSPSAHLNWLSTELNVNSSSGSSSNYTVSLANAPSSYFTGLNFKFRPNHTNTGTATLNVNSLGAKTIKLLSDDSGTKDDVLENQILQGHPSEVYYDGTDFILVNPIVGVPFSWTPTLGVTGGTFTNTSVTYATYVQIGKLVWFSTVFTGDTASDPTTITYTLPVTANTTVASSVPFSATYGTSSRRLGLADLINSTTGKMTNQVPTSPLPNHTGFIAFVSGLYIAA